jgi:glutamate-1-semialdehyde 2,1-aminomutase
MTMVLNEHSDETASLHPFQRGRIERFVERESSVFNAAEQLNSVGPVSGWYQNVPMHWMLDWPVRPIIQKAQGAIVTTVQGRSLNDFCLGDSAALFGHSPARVVKAIEDQLNEGMSTMLVDQRAAQVGALLVERFKLPHWQMALSASDANRFAIRAARAITGRDLVLVFDGCYHGAVEDVMVTLDNSRVKARPGLIGQVGDLRSRARVVEFNNLRAVRQALRDRRVACVLAEPVMTNCGMVEPEPGFWDQVRELTFDTVTPLILDETHTLSNGPGGYGARFDWQPDFKVFGKPIAGGLPAAVWGFTDAISQCLTEVLRDKPEGHSGIGTTLSANALSLAAMEAVLQHYLNPSVFEPMIQKAEYLSQQLRAVFVRHQLRWQVIQSGARVEIVMSPKVPKTARDVMVATDSLLEKAIHVGLLNRGSLLTPFHNMMLISPATQIDQINQLVNGLDEVLTQLSVS